jgi:hypothetical protein
MKRVEDTPVTALYSSASRMYSVDVPSPSNSTSAEGEKSLRTHSPVVRTHEIFIRCSENVFACLLNDE